MKRLSNYIGSIVSRNSSNSILSGAMLFAVIISFIHFLTYNNEEIYLEFLHELLTKLYFLPVLIAALLLGKKGAIQLSLTVSVLYLPHSINTMIFSKLSIIENLSEVVLIWTVGIVAGGLIDKLKSVHSEKARLLELEQVSTVLNVINKDIMSDY